VPAELLAAIKKRWAVLCEQWDEMYPENPVSSEENTDD
jgi:hypothetical protein